MQPAELSGLILCFSLLMYVLLDGTDLGVGMLFFWFGEEKQRELMSHSILPIWDANETWLVLFAGGMLALFPAVYSLVLSSLAAPVFIMLLSLFGRALALEYRAEAPVRLRRWLDRLMAVGSALAAFTQGWCAGVIITPQSDGGINLAAIISGLGTMTIYMLLASCWIRWRLGDPVFPLAGAHAWMWWVTSILISIALLLLTPSLWLQCWHRPFGKLIIFMMGLFWFLQLITLWRGNALWLLIITLTLITTTLTGIICAIYPWIIPGQVNLYQSTSSSVTQQVILIGAAIMIPLTLIYHTWSFWIMKGHHPK